MGVSIARTGEMIYGEQETPIEADEKGRVLIQRDESEVFRPETIASFEGKAVTITHPVDFVSPENWSRLAKGVLQNVRRGEGDQKNDLIADLLITDSVAILLVKNGLREVSCGYEAEYIQTEEGKGIQTNIVGNHLALVEQGRAGSAYAINDHKGKGAVMKLKDKIKTIFAKAQDEAMEAAEDVAAKEDPPAKKDEKVGDAPAYDELLKMVKDIGEKISAMAKPKDDAAPAAAAAIAAAKEEKSGDEVAASLEDRLKALEASVAKLLEVKASAGDESEEESEESESEDADEGEEESEDDDFEESTMTGDTASRAEILAPGIKITKDVKAKALAAAYGTKEGKAIIDALTGGTVKTFDSAERVETLFIATSEILKTKRSNELATTKQTRDSEADLDDSGVVTAEKLNEINAKYYSNRNKGV